MEQKSSSTVGCLLSIVGVFLSLPLWFFLLYQILVRVDATPVMWIAYWLYVPTNLTAGVLAYIHRELE